MIARNEEASLGDTLDSLINQTHELDLIVVVDDGSTDSTPEIAEERGVLVVSLPYHKESYVGRPELSTVCNAGLESIKRNSDPDFILQMGAEHILSRDYLKSVLYWMGEDVKVASGGTQLEKLNPGTPWGSGRLIDARVWAEINGVQYPEKYGYESWIVYKILKLGFKVRRYDDIPSFTRPVRMSPKKAFYWGRSSYALGGSVPFALIKAFSMGKDGFHFLKGYFSRKNVEKHEDIAKFVKRQQIERGFRQMGLFRVEIET